MTHKIGKTTTMKELYPCPQCKDMHKDIVFKPYTAKESDPVLYTHMATCPGEKGGLIPADLTNDSR